MKMHFEIFISVLNGGGQFLALADLLKGKLLSLPIEYEAEDTPKLL
jgi:hypothetical protein